MLRYLRRAEEVGDGKLEWGILTNGRQWRLYWQGARSRAEEFLELDLPAILGIPGFPLDLFATGVGLDHWLRVFVLMLLLVSAAACNKDESPVSPSDPAAIQPIVVESFTGTIGLLGSSFYSFTVPTNGNVSLLLHSLSEAGAASTAIMGLGLGVPRGTDCTVTNPAATGPGATAQLTTSVPPGVYCVRITDLGNLTAPATFAINIIRPR